MPSWKGGFYLLTCELGDLSVPARPPWGCWWAGFGTPKYRGWDAPVGLSFRSPPRCPASSWRPLPLSRAWQEGRGTTIRGATAGF